MMTLTRVQRNTCVEYVNTASIGMRTHGKSTRVLMEVRSGDTVSIADTVMHCTVMG